MALTHKLVLKYVFFPCLQTVADQLQWMPTLIQKLVLNLIASVEGEDIFYEISVHDLLWGYEDPLLKLLKVLDPKLVPETKFGLFVGVSLINSSHLSILIGHAHSMQSVFEFNLF